MPGRLLPKYLAPVVALALAILTPFLWGIRQKFAPVYFATVTLVDRS